MLTGVSVMRSRRSKSGFLGRMISGSKPVAEKPGFLEPCLATLQSEVPTGAGWLHDFKFDGYPKTKVEAFAVLTFVPS